MIILPSWRHYAAAACAALLFTSGWTVRGWWDGAQQAKALRDTAQRAQIATTAVNAAATTYEAQRRQISETHDDNQNAIRAAYRTVFVPTACAAQPDIVRVLNSSVDTANAATTGESSGSVFAPAAPSKPPH